eukprot:2992502-Amphidinium_carterae.1
MLSEPSTLISHIVDKFSTSRSGELFSAPTCPAYLAAFATGSPAHTYKHARNDEVETKHQKDKREAKLPASRVHSSEDLLNPLQRPNDVNRQVLFASPNARARASCPQKRIVNATVCLSGAHIPPGSIARCWSGMAHTASGSSYRLRAQKAIHHCISG